MTMFYTILTGVLIFVLGRIIEKVIIDPIKEHRSVIGEIYDGLIFHAGRISSPLKVTAETTEAEINRYNEASKDIRRLSMKLRVAIYNINWFYKFYSFFGAPKFNDISETCRTLIGLSNSLFQTKHSDNVLENIAYKKSIMDKLKLTKFEDKLLK